MPSLGKQQLHLAVVSLQTSFTAQSAADRELGWSCLRTWSSAFTTVTVRDGKSEAPLGILAFNQSDWEKKTMGGAEDEVCRGTEWEWWSTEMLNCQTALSNSNHTSVKGKLAAAVCNFWLERLSVHLSEAPDCWCDIDLWEGTEPDLSCIFSSCGLHGLIPQLYKTWQPAADGSIGIREGCIPQRAWCCVKQPSVTVNDLDQAFRRSLKYTLCVIKNYEHFLPLPRRIMS